ncbi:MAG: hypothetical protein DMG89_10285 [Acidobacteria bacterium]|nr:MAG: hypothetical protein DMG89_10285 [Acidobacteriota bacterium]
MEILIHFVVNADRNDPNARTPVQAGKVGSERLFRPLSVRENRTVATALDNFIPTLPSAHALG